MSDADRLRSLESRVRALEALTLVDTFVTFRDGLTTPSVGGARKFATANTAPTTITAFLEGKPGQEIIVKIGDANTTIDFTGTTLKGNAGANWSPGSGDFMRCTFDGTNWLCQITEI